MDTDVSCVAPWLVDIHRDGTTLEVRTAGDHTWDDAELLPDLVLARSSGVERVRVDIAEIGLIDSALLRALLRCQALLAPIGASLSVRGANDHARRLFEVTNLQSLLDESDTADV